MADANAIQWSDEEGPRAHDSWACDGGGEWHWHPGFVHDHEEAQDRARFGLFSPGDVHPDHRSTPVEERDEPTVCIAHGRFIPCRKDGEHRHTSNPYWVKSVRDYQGSPIDNLTWEPAWENGGPS